QGAAAELAGADAILVGSALMQADDPAGKLRELLARPLVKVCGLTRQEDVDAALEAGADPLGFILVEQSPRRASGVLDVPDDRLSVAVFVGEAEDAGSDLVQLYEREEGRVRGREAGLLRTGEQVARVVDLPWDESDPLHLQRAVECEGRVMLAGRLSPDNVREAVRAVRPWAVDAASRLEKEPGIKDHAKVHAFVAAARCQRSTGRTPGATFPRPSSRRSTSWKPAGRTRRRTSRSVRSSTSWAARSRVGRGRGRPRSASLRTSGCTSSAKISSTPARTSSTTRSGRPCSRAGSGRRESSP